jgi:hypothetical protein
MALTKIHPSSRGPLCVVRLDRLKVLASPGTRGRLPEPPGYKTIRDSFVRRQTTTRTYLRCRWLLNEQSGTQVFWQYAPQRSWLAPWKITFITDDRKSLPPEDVLSVLAQCANPRLLLAEMAFDFNGTSGVDERFILQHAVFGKSRPNSDRGGCGHLRYGSRASATLVRAYPKKTINRYRVELELHSGFLRSRQLWEFRQLKNLGRVLLPSRFRMVVLDWDALNRNLLGRLGDKSRRVLALARTKSTSIYAMCLPPAQGST